MSLDVEVLVGNCGLVRVPDFFIQNQSTSDGGLFSLWGLKAQYVGYSPPSKGNFCHQVLK